MESRPISLASRQLLAAPFVGALAGFLFNRVHAGNTGWLLLGEMTVGAALFAFGAVVHGLLDTMAIETARRNAIKRQMTLAQAARQTTSRQAELLASEQRRYEQARRLLDRQLAAERHAQGLQLELSQTRRETVQLANVVAGLVSHMRHQVAHPTAELAAEARARMEAIEAAQNELTRRQVELDRKTASEAEEVKTRLLQLSVSESQRQRNMEAPEQQSGRIIELEGRIRKLAREIERLSQRQAVTVETGEASKVAQGGTADGARMGFLKAMLEANQVLRRQIKDAA